MRLSGEGNSLPGADRQYLAGQTSGVIGSKAPRERGIEGTRRKAFAVLTGTSDVRQVVARLPKRTSANCLLKPGKAGEKEM